MSTGSGLVTTASTADGALLQAATSAQPASADIDPELDKMLVAGSGGPDRSGPESSPVHALFDVSTRTGGPFPSNVFTTADRSQNTGRRINLPLPDCKAQPSECEDLNVINTLDGFDFWPRFSIPFDGPIDVKSVTSSTVFLVSLGDTLNHHDHGGQVVGLPSVLWNPATTTLQVQANVLLAQHTRYALIVTNGVHDEKGDPVEPTPAFRRFRQELHGDLRFYRQELIDAMRAARRVGVRERDIVTASVFTTQSVTAMLEKVRDQIKAATPAPADFLLGQDGSRTVFDLASVRGVTWLQQTRTNPPAFNSVQLDLSLLDVYPGAIGQVAFGKYVSPEYRNAERFFPPIGTRTGTPRALGNQESYFNLYLPSGERPAAGWPVVLFGHGAGNNKNTTSLNVAASLAAHGIATVAINHVGHGFGPLGTLTVNQAAGEAITFPAGGRGIDANEDGVIESNEGQQAAAPGTIIGPRDGWRQGAVDLMQLVRQIEVGMDVDGDGSPDLNPSRIYYFGNSLGSTYGSPFVAVEPNVRVSVLAVAGAAVGSVDDVRWVRQASSPAAYAPHFRTAPLPGVPAKSVLFPFAKCDQTVTNPTTSVLLLAGDLADRAVLYRHDLAFAENPQLPRDPHGIAVRIDHAAFQPLVLAEQQQIATFFASDGIKIIQPEPARFFEVPVHQPLPDDHCTVP